MSELEFATKLANKILNDSSRDPDSDLSALARQFLRSREREERLRTELAQVAQSCEDMANAAEAESKYDEAKYWRKVGATAAPAP